MQEKQAKEARPQTAFKYLVDEFADLKIIRYRVPDWDSLSLKQKEYVYYLSEAAKCGRDILWDQNFKYNLAVRKVIENIIQTYKGERNCQEYKDFEVYAKRVFFSNGIHHHYGEDKILPACGADYMKTLIDNSAPLPYAEKMIPVMCDPALYPVRKGSGEEGDMLLSSASNFYDHVTKKEAEDFYAAQEDPGDPRPVSYGLNSKLVKRDGKITEEVYRTTGLYAEALKPVCEYLKKAEAAAENPEQAAYIAQLIRYYQTGDLRIWDHYNVLWVQDTLSDIDFNNGFIESYGDPLGRKANWGANVSILDKVSTRRTRTISDNAQWFEDHSPVDRRFKKKVVKGVSAKVINIAMLGGDNYPSTPIGINLPNADWIRKEYGSKSVTIANISHAYDKAAEESPHSMLQEFSWDRAEVDLLKKYGSLTSDLHTDLHECLGHGSGQLLPGVSSSALKEYSSTLEEARADLFALYFLADPKLVELNVLPDGEAYKAAYINHIKNGLFTQLVRIESGKSLTEAHMQCRQLVSLWCYEHGRRDNVIEMRLRDGKTYVIINDFVKLRELFGQLLAEIQRIKSEGDYTAGKALVENYGMRVNPLWHREVKKRYAALELKPYGGFINPEIKPVVRRGKTVDYALTYVDDYLQQMLDYGRDYAFLPVFTVRLSNL